jgi:hypothetical protein
MTKFQFFTIIKFDKWELIKSLKLYYKVLMNSKYLL